MINEIPYKAINISAYIKCMSISDLGETCEIRFLHILLVLIDKQSQSTTTPTTFYHPNHLSVPNQFYFPIICAPALFDIQRCISNDF